MRYRLFLFLWLGLSVLSQAQTTHTAADCNASTIDTLVDSGSVLSGDTIIVPAGPCTWDGGGSRSTPIISVPNTKTLSIQAQDTDITITGFATNASAVTLGTSNSSWTGFNITYSDTESINMIRAEGTGCTGKIYGNTFTNTTSQNRRAILFADNGTDTHPCYTVYDNYFDGMRVQITGGAPPGRAGWQWTNGGFFGNRDNGVVTIERNEFVYTIAGNCIEGDNGSYFVARYNEITGAEIHQHGTGAGDGPTGADEHPPGRMSEIYGNTFYSPNGKPGIWIRSGSAVVFSNWFASSYTNKILMDIQGRTPSGTCGNDTPPEDSYCVDSFDPAGTAGNPVPSDGNQMGGHPSTGALGWDAFAQPGYAIWTSTYVRFSYPGQTSVPIAIFYNRSCASPPCTLMDTKVNPTFQNDSDDYIVDGYEYQNENTSFDGSLGTGVGTRASRPAAMDSVDGVYYWATDAGGNWNTLEGGSNDGCLDRMESGAWVDCKYTPEEYPYPGTSSATQVGFTVQPSASYTGGQTVSVSVAIQDEDGNTVTAATNTISLTPSGCNLYGTTSADAVAGVASFTPTVGGNGTCTIVAASSGLASDTSDSFTVTTAAPSTAVTVPTAGATVSGAAVTLTATASSALGIAGVQFKVDGIATGSEDTSAPYTISWNSTTVANGSHTITSTARDLDGTLTTSSGVSISVNNTAAGVSGGAKFRVVR